MFNKSTFGGASTSGFGFNNTATASPFGQSTFGKPATAGFGQAPAFGQQNTSLFGGGNQPAGGLFGTNTASPFGAPQATTQAGFGGGFAQPTNTSVFGNATTNQNTSIFGQSGTSAFGAAKPSGFGFGGTQPSTSIFGQATTSTTPGTSFFGQQNAAGSSIFGAATAPAFGGAAPTGTGGTSIAKYQPSMGTDTLMKNGQANNVSTKQHCITTMKEYENKSLEELRMEDYMANRKGPQAGAVGGIFGAQQPSAGLFGAPAPQQTSGLFGTTENKGLFGNTNTMAGGFGQANAFGATTSQPSAGGLFNKPFAAPTTSASGFGFGNTANQATNSLFGAKPFGAPATGSVFGQPQTNAAAPSAFGQPSTGFGGFGQTTANQGNTLFGQTADKPAFGMAATSTGFGFGTNTNTMSGGSLFQPKPTTGFGAPTGAFGTTTSMTSGFGGFGQPNAGGSLFNSSFNKPATTGFGTFGQPAVSAPLGGLGASSGGGLFGGAVNKPGGFFGSNTGATTGGGLFNNSLSFGNNNLMGGLGQSTLGIGGAPTLGQSQITSPPVHQQILALTTSPYGDNPIFKDLKPPGGISEDALKPTNPAAQKAILESSGSQFKVSSAKMESGVKVKPIANGLSKKSLFEGLEEYDSTVEENFNLKPNARRLIISKGCATPSRSFNDSAPGTPHSSLFSDKRRSSLNVSTPGLLRNVDNKENNESFNNEIPTTMSKMADNTRRVSWLHSNLDKNRNRNSDAYFESTIQELVAEKQTPDSGNQNSTSGVSSGSKMSSPQNVQDDKETAGHLRSFQDMAESPSRGDGSEAELVDTSNVEVHPTGIVQRRSGYYTIPSLDELLSYLKEDGTCVVNNFTIGRERYGNVFFDEVMDVAGLNLDETVFFRHKEVVIYPKDDNKPPVGVGLNRPAQVTLDQVWPHDKATHESIKDPDRLQAMGYEDCLRRVCKKHDTRFVEYRPETGSWVFKVDHFSKYGLTDSDEETIGPVDPAKKAKLTPRALGQKGAMEAGSSKQMTEMPAGTASAAISDPDIDELRQMTTTEAYEMEDDFDMDFMPTPPFSSHTYPVSPSASMAVELGAKSHKLQLMKAAFFTEDDYDNRSVCTDSVAGRESPSDQDQIVPSRHLGSRFSSMQSMFKGSSVMSLQTQSEDTPIVSYTLPPRVDTIEKRLPRHIIEPPHYPLVVEPKIAIVNTTGSIIPYEKSLAKRLEGKCVADVGILSGRRFKVGWGPRNAITLLTTTQAIQDIQRATTTLSDFDPVFSGRKAIDKSPGIAMRLEVASVLPIRGFQRSIQKHLVIQLKHCEKIFLSASECPQFLPAGGTDLLAEHCQLAREQQNLSQHDKYAVTVWSLCEALWGEEEELQGQDPASHLTVMRRRELLSNWLEEVVSEKPLNSTEKSDYLEYLLQLLYAHKVTEACELAFMKRDMNLSMMIAQSSGGPVVRQLIHHQLASWQEVEADKYIDVRRLKVFMLVAGIPLLSSANEAVNDGKGGTINVFQDADWITALALNLWYLCSPTASITDALLNYESAFTSEDGVAAKPNPPYTDYEVESKNPIQDLRYHLLKLYSKRSHRIESLLNPATHTADSLDIRLSWLLLQTLDTLGYHHCSEKSECQLHTSFASQLENYGMWHWSIFVLLHIRNRERREISVQQMLYRYITLPEEGDEEYRAKENFVVEKLHIPMTWIYWAKAVRAGSMRKYHEQAEFLIRAKQWNLAHEVIMNHLGPDAIINDNIPYLKGLLESLKETKKIMNWRNQGQILYDFIDMNEKFESLKMVSENDLVTHWEGLKPQLDELCSRINLFPCPTAKHRLCQSEISQRLACLVRGILMTSPHLNPCLLIKVALEKLPLPQEYAQRELKFFIDSVMVDTFQNTTVPASLC